MKREEALELIERMPFITTVRAPNDKIRIELYKEAIEGADPLEWIRVVKSSYIRTHEPSGKTMLVSKQEAQYGEAAKKLLETELAEALGIREDEVENYINTYLEENQF